MPRTSRLAEAMEDEHESVWKGSSSSPSPYTADFYDNPNAVNN
jgi:hypothetical protein